MSFFKDLVAEVQKELSAATAELNTDLQKSVSDLRANPVAYLTKPQSGSKSRQAAPLSASMQRGADSGVVTHSAGSSASPATRNRPGEQRPQPKKRRKKPSQQSQSAAATTSPQEKKASLVLPHRLVANLTPTVARNSIIMSEVLGPPVSKRQRRGWR